MRRHNISEPLWAFLCGAVALALYLVTLQPGVVGGDAGEFQFTPYVLGIPHSTGYPLYLLLGKLWSFLPFGSIAGRMNALAAFCSAGAALFTWLSIREIKIQPCSAIPAVLSLVLNAAVWEFSIIAGVRSLNMLFFAVLIWLALRWKNERRQGKTGRSSLLLIAFLAGLGLAHHRTIIFLLAPLLWFIERNEPELLRRPRRWPPLLALCLLTPLVFYVWLWLRAISPPPFSWVPINTAADYFRLISGENWSGALLPGAMGPQLAGRLLQTGKFLWQTMSLPVVLLSLLGLLGQLRRRRQEAVLLGFPVLCLAAFTVIYDIGGEQLGTKYLLPAFISGAVWTAEGLEVLAGWLTRQLKQPVRIMQASLCGLLCLGCLGLQGIPTWQALEAARYQPLDDYRQLLTGSTAGRFAREALTAAAPGGLIIADWEQATAMWYMQYAEGFRRDVTVHHPMDDWKELAEQAQQQHRAVYLSRKVPDLQGTSMVSMAGPLIQLEEGPLKELTSTGWEKSRYDFGGQMALIGYRQSLLRVPGLPGGRDRAVLRLGLAWQALQAMKTDYSLSLRVFDSEGQQLAQLDSAHPVMGLYPTHKWTAGEIVEEYDELLLPPLPDNAEAHAELILYYRNDQGEFINLTLADMPGESQKAALPPLKW